MRRRHAGHWPIKALRRIQLLGACATSCWTASQRNGGRCLAHPFGTLPRKMTKTPVGGEAEPVAAQTLGEVFAEAGTISLTAQPAPKGTSRPKQSRTADWTAEPEGQDQPQQPSRCSKRPAPKPLTSMPVKASRKNHRAAVPSSSSSEESDEEESLPLASAKARKVSASCQGF